MNTKITVSLIVLCCMNLFTIKAQKITPPSDGKAVIYFLRTNGTGAMINFRYFENDKYLGKFQGKNFFRYECDPGESLFWVKAENIDFVETNLKSGGIYMIEVKPVPGAFSSGVKLKLFDYNNENHLKKIQTLFENKDGVTFTDDELKKGQEKMNSIIKSGIKKVNKRRNKKGIIIKRIDSEMTYPLQQ